MWTSLAIPAYVVVPATMTFQSTRSTRDTDWLAVYGRASQDRVRLASYCLGVGQRRLIVGYRANGNWTRR